MKVLKCVKTDFRMMKNNAYMFDIFFALGLFLSFTKETLIPWAYLYMLFVGLVFVTMPFFVQTRFIAVLPADHVHRVFGRYLYGSLMILLCSLAGMLSGSVSMLIRGRTEWYSRPEMFFLILGVGLAVMALEFLATYLLKIKNPQLMSIVRLVPGFAVIFGGSSFMNALQQQEHVPDFLRWCLANTLLVSLLVLAAGVLVVLACAAVCCAHEKKRY